MAFTSLAFGLGSTWLFLLLIKVLKEYLQQTKGVKVKHVMFFLLFIFKTSFLWASPDKPLPVVIVDKHNFQVCYNFHCNMTTIVEVDQKAWDEIDLLRNDYGLSATHMEELQLIRKAVAVLEAEVGRSLGIFDLGRNPNADGAGFQWGCIDETNNSRVYVALLEKYGYLKHWEVGNAEHKGFFIGHWVVSVRHKKSGEKWIVDSWYLDMGRLPYIQEYKVWKKQSLRRPNFDCQLNPEQYSRELCKRGTYLNPTLLR